MMVMEDYDHLLTELSDLSGIIPEYYDIFGRKHAVTKEQRIAVLSAMHLTTATVEELRSEIERIKLRPWLCVLEPVTVISVSDQPHVLAVHLPLPPGADTTTDISVTVEDEQGRKDIVRLEPGAFTIDEHRIIKGRRFVRVKLSLPPKDPGYYTVYTVGSNPEPIFETGGQSLQASGRLIIAPDACYMPEELQSGRTWGVAVNLYAVRSRRNWGAGDVGDLRSLVTWLAGLKGGMVGINPLHDIPNTVPFGISPYSPITRLYRNFIYINMDRVEELAGLPVPDNLQQRIEALRAADRVDYEGVASLKRELLEQCFRSFYLNHYQSESSRGTAFRQYLLAEGEQLMQYACFLALSEHLKNERDRYEWPAWPEEFRSPQSAAVTAFRNSNEERILFFAYLQWLLDSQLAEVSAAAVSAHMPVGLYGDLAIGAHEGGSDVWMYQDVVAEDVNVGVPPDDFNHNGQDWGFPPMIPDRLRETGYDLFIQTIRRSMRHLGAIRIDHAPGLFRLFWIPKGMKPADGVYVRCRSEDLLRIIALESARNHTLVIGEDLGTITDEMRSGLHRFGMLSYRLFYFERNHPDPSFLPPERYPEMALSAITTHDLPTLYGFWSGRDLELKHRLGIGSESQLAQQRTDRERDRTLILQTLTARGLFHGCPSGDASCIREMSHELCCALYGYLSQTPSKLVLVSLDDVIATMDQQNFPGTVSEYPNWRQKIPLLLEHIETDPRWQELASAIMKYRRQPG